MGLADPAVAALQKTLLGLNKKAEEGLFTVGSENNWSNVDTWVSTGSTLMDIAMTSYDKDGKPVGSGWAAGRWYEVFGEEAGGKSTIVEHLFAEIQKIGGIPALIDSESKLYKPRAQAIGVDLSKLILIDAPYFERGIEGFNMLMEALRANPVFASRPVAMGWDSIAAVNTKAEFESGEYAGGQAEKARKAHAMFRDLTNKLPQYKAVFVLVNQIRDTMGGRFEKQTDTTGGRGAKYFASARIEVRNAGVYNDPENPEIPQGIICRIKFVKSSLFRPYAEVDLPLNFMTGIDNPLSLVWFHTQATKLFANQSGVYRSAAFLGMDGDKAKGLRLPALLKQLREDELLMDMMIQKARENGSLLWKKAASYANKEKEKKGEG
jgi:recombination protein RecA